MEAQAAAARGVTLRSVILGSLIAAFICWITPYNDYVVANTFFVGGYLPLAMVLVFFTIAVFVNPLLLRVSRRLGFTTRELAVVMTMTLVSCAIPSQGLLRAFIPQLVAPFYHGRGNTPFWNAFVGMNLPAWLFPVPNIADGRFSPIVMDFYGAVSPGAPIPYGAWVRPLLGWGIFVAGLLASLVSLAWLLRVQWGQNERLPFPLAQLQMSLIEAPEPGRYLNPIFRSRGFWIALCSVFVLQSISALHDYFPREFPDVPLTYDFTRIFTEPPLSYLPAAVKKATVYFTFVGVAYFIQARTAFSLWSIYLITQIIGMQSRWTFQNEIPAAAWRDQHFGSGLVYLAGMIWIGRHYWGRVIRSALGRAHQSHEAVFANQYRMTLLGFLGGTALMIGWLLWLKVGFWMSLLIVFVILSAHVVTARIVAETGMSFVRAYWTSPQIYTLFPPSRFSMRDLYFSGVWTSNGAFTTRESLLGFSTHALRVADQTEVLPRERGRLAVVIIWTLLLSFSVGSWSHLKNHYSYSMQLTAREQKLVGWHSLEDQPAAEIVTPMTRFADSKQFAPKAHNPYLHFGIGIGMTALLQLAAWRIPGWPFLPVGYLVSGAQFIGQAWFSMLLGWLAKVLILRFGGAGLFQAGRSIFIGMIFGEALAAGVWLLVNLILAANGYTDYQPLRFLPG